MQPLQPLVDAADPAALLRAVDGLIAAREWDTLVDLADRCRKAIELGRQLWPVAMHIDYRLAWEGPAAHAAAVLQPGAGRFALGPLTEVAASTHDWASLAPHLRNPPSAAAVAQERVLRGEDLRERVGVSAVAVLSELPLRLQRWEPAYALPRYRDREAAFPQPMITPEPAVALDVAAGAPAAQDDATRALTDLVEVWTTQSRGSARAVMVEGTVADAIGALLGSGRAELRRLTSSDALALLQWTGASGGAYGRRPGGARGRFAAWWTAAALAGLAWPVSADELGAAIEELCWYQWSPPGLSVGWTLRLAVEDPVDALAWALEAVDQRDDDVGGGTATVRT